MAKQEVKKLTVAEQRELLEKQLADLEVLERVEREISDLISQYEGYLKGACTTSIPDGLEEEQAKNYNGELLYVYKGEDGYEHRYTEKEFKEKGIDPSECQPYYRTKYREEIRPIESLYDWDKTRALAYTRLIKFFKSIDVTQIGE